MARNRITDWFRRRKPESPGSPESELDGVSWEDTLPSAHDGPDARYAQVRMVDELLQALEDLPEAQRAVFLAHEIEGLSFRQIADQTGESVNTLLSRKHAAGSVLAAATACLL